jgi:hypothetical protein
MGTPPQVAIIARLRMPEPRLRNTKRDTSLRNHDRLTYFISIVTFTYALSPAVADRGLHRQPEPEGKSS